MQHADYIVLLPTIAVVLVATTTDLREHRIPNWLVLPFLVLGLIVSATRHGSNGLGQSSLGVIAAVAVMGVFVYLGGMGMGDLKLCAALGAWLGPSQVCLALVLTGLVGGVMALVWALAGGFLSQSLRGAGELLWGLGKGRLRAHETLVLSNPIARRMPYAPAIAIGAICSFAGKN